MVCGIILCCVLFIILAYDDMRHVACTMVHVFNPVCRILVPTQSHRHTLNQNNAMKYKGYIADCTLFCVLKFVIIMYIYIFSSVYCYSDSWCFGPLTMEV